MPKSALIVFMKAPLKGRVKTRLARGIGEENATRMYSFMCEALMQQSTHFRDVYVAYDALGETTLPEYLTKASLFPQEGDDLGERMYHAFQNVFSMGYERAILVGSDIPLVNAPLLEDALHNLASHDAILSATLDGGYYLIGFHASTLCQEAFENIVYSTHDVYETTMKRLSHLNVAHGIELGDIDTKEDLDAFMQHYPTHPLTHFAHTLLDKPIFSVIIPVYNEDETLRFTCEHLRAMAQNHTYEIIVVDTFEKTTMDRIALDNVRWVLSQKGRAFQMNEGARYAKGGILLFLHADTRLPYHWDAKIQESLQKHEAGAFTLGIEDKRLIFSLIATLANIRTTITRIPYGDQAHFFRKTTFDALEGYAPVPLMEDIEIMKRLKHAHRSIALLPERVLTSPRRWLKEGILYTSLRNRVLSFLYWLGISPHALIRHYKPHQK